MSILRKALPTTLREIRLFGCQTGQASAGVREFIKSSYPEVKRANPDIPILIRESEGTPARAFARFEFGVEKSVMLEGCTSAVEVEKRMESLFK